MIDGLSTNSNGKKIYWKIKLELQNKFKKIYQIKIRITINNIIMDKKIN